MFRRFVPSRMRMFATGDKVHKFADFLSIGSREAIYLRALSHWNPSQVVLNAHDPGAVDESIKELAKVLNVRLEEVMMLTDLLNYLPDEIFPKVDRASMAVSLEARVPLLDHRVVEFAWQLPLHFKIRNGTSKWILRQILHKYVPPELLERPKMGFGVPIDSWLRGPLREWAEELLSESSLNRHGFFAVRPIRTKWEQNLSGTRNWQYLLWDVLVFQDWLNNPSQPPKREINRL